MPDLFTCHISDATALGSDNLVDWNAWFTAEELSNFVPGFLADGMTEDGTPASLPYFQIHPASDVQRQRLCPLSQSTGVSYADLSTWEGFYDAAGKFYDWSGGEAFCALDYPIRSVELNALEHGSGDFYTKTAGMIPIMPYSRRAGCSSPALWLRAMWWSPISIPTRRS